MKKIASLVFFVLVLMKSVQGQTPSATSATRVDRVQKLIMQQHYSTAYVAADSIRAEAMRMTAQLQTPDADVSRQLLTATWLMEMAAVKYQEDAMDSSMARFRAIMPHLVPVDRVLCYLFLGRVDSALADTLSLRGVPNSHIANFCSQPKEALFNITPTMYDLVMQLAVQNVPLEQGLELQKQLVDYSRSRGDMNLTLYNELRWLSLMESKPNLSKQYRRRQVQERLNRYRSSGNEQLAQLYRRLASMAEEEKDFVGAVAYCDSAINRWPKSEGGVQCANMKNQIQECHIEVEMRDVEAAGRDILVRVNSRNVADLYYRVIAYPSNYDLYRNNDENTRTMLLKSRVLKSWHQTLTDGTPAGRPLKLDDYQYHRHYGYVPALAPGHYMLLVSPTADFKSKGFVVHGFTVAGAAIVLTQCDNTGVSGYVVDVVSGEPVRHQRVALQRSRSYPVKYTDLGSVQTDADGFFAFEQQMVDKDETKKGDYRYYDYRLMMRHRGLEITRDLSLSGRGGAMADRRDYELFVDRPVYRPGDTVKFLLVGASFEGGREGSTLGGQQVRVELRDVNRKAVDSLRGVTDEFGRLSGQFVIAPRALPGSFGLMAFGPIDKSSNKAGTVRSGRGEEMVAQRYLNVESYKQPKFTVTLKSQDRRDNEGNSLAPQMGDSLVVEGLAASYTQAPVGGARVKWSVTRSMVRPWWRRWYSNAVHYGTHIVASDSLTTDPEGLFRIAFVAEPDSSVELSTRPSFQYLLTVDVTDLNGETHSQQLTLKAGYENSYVHITLPQQTARLDNLTYQYNDLNGTPLKGYVVVSVERLRMPANLWIDHPQLREGVCHTLSEAEFHKRFPLTPYSYNEERMEHWPVAERVFLARMQSEGQVVNSIKLPILSAGAYRIILTPDSGPGALRPVADTAVVIYTPTEGHQVYTQRLLWSDVSSETARVGDTLTLRVGTRHSGVRVLFRLTHGGRLLERRVLKLSGGIESLSIPVSDTLLGGFEIELCAIKEGRTHTATHRVEVPYEHKKLNVEFVTFRDKLTPGEHERWTLRVSKARNEAGAVALTPPPAADAAMLLGMYDAALNSYGHLSFGWWPWRDATSESLMGTYYDFDWRYQNNRQLLVSQHNWLFYKGKTPAGWEFTALNHRGWRDRRLMRGTTVVESIVATVGGVGYATARGEGGMETTNAVKMAKSRRVPNAPEVVTELTVVEDAMEMEEVDAYGEYGEVVQEATVKPEVPYLRTNLSTLAFFEPTLRTDANGTVEYSFTAPDLLTEWDVKGLAWTRDLAVGNVERKLITRKQLMVQPNMPRFLREGDSAVVMAKVVNLTDSNVNATVRFNISIPMPDGTETEEQAERSVTLPAHGSEAVLFPVTVPVGGTVATYKFVATASNHSDGEQGPLPLLTNRQAVTQSVSMYMNGAGRKQYAMELPVSSTAQPVSFTIEYTANPIWLAIQTLPYMAECANPSNIYLASSYYVNKLGKTIADQYPELKNCADGATEAESPLLRNADVRQTLLDETPWLRDGNSEVERLRNIARFYDTEELERQCSDTWSKLVAAQRADGSWSWMPGGRYGSTYVTQHILKVLGNLSRQLTPGSFSRPQKQGLAYIDKEAYRTYLEWQQYLAKHPGSTFRPIMLDYLYTRSLYSGKAFAGQTQTAFDYFYNNAKQRYSDYTSLYDQALLALVFQRGGDTRLAREMVTRIKQKALYSDEMGMYWRDNRAGYFYYQRPVETQALLIETFREVMPSDTLAVSQMQQWLLKQKQTTRWSSDIATLRAIQALMPSTLVNRSIANTAGQPIVDMGTKSNRHGDRIVVSGGTVLPRSAGAKGMTDTLLAPSSGTGYLRHSYHDDSLNALASGRTVTATIVRPNKGIAWGALYYQYTEQMDKIQASETGITLRRELYKVNPDGSLSPLKSGLGYVPLHVGDHLRVRLHVACDRNLEYVELKEFRAACLEPVSTASGWVWSAGLSYYVAINNSHNAVYIDRLEKGKYTIDADYYVTNPGSFTLAPSVLQCLYAPEFRATSLGQRIIVK